MLTQRAIYQNLHHNVTRTLKFHCFSCEYGATIRSQILQTKRKYVQQMQIRSFRSGKLFWSNINPSPIELQLHGGSIPSGNLMKATIFAGAFSLGCFAGATIMEYENTRNGPDWGHLKSDIKRYWNMLTPGEKVFGPLCAFNLIVFTLWRLPSWRSRMLTYFTSNPAAQIICWPMCLSTFSHYSALHLFANMYVLHSFSNVAVMSLGKEQFLALYLSAGVLSSLSSVLYKAATSQTGVSLGASGAIMTILAYVCTQYPDTQLSTLFLPTLTFSAGSAIKVIMGIDFAGCVMGWKFFDHAAHLGGAIYGLIWAHFGSQLWAKRIILLNCYHDLRKSKDK